MLKIEQVDTTSKSQVDRFVHLPFGLYKNHPQWVPPLLIDSKMYLNKEKHPFYEHSEADFFIATQDGRDVGRIAVLHNRRFNDYHKTKQAQFYFFDTEDDIEIASALFERIFEWATMRGLDQMVGPKGFGPLDGYGLLVDGFEHRQMMNMMNYNYPYYPKLVKELDFKKEVDFVSCFLNNDEFKFPQRIHSISERVQKRGTLTVHRFTKKKALVQWSNRIGKAYNDSFVNNWEYYPLTENEISFVVDNLMMVANPRLIKIITHDDDVVGFLFGFPDVSAAMQRAKGRLFPTGLIDILLEMRRTKWIALNGAGILPEFQGRGGNALLYSEMEKTVKGFGFKYADLTQVAETAVQMRNDLVNIGGKPYKNHRVFRRSL